MHPCEKFSDAQLATTTVTWREMGKELTFTNYAYSLEAQVQVVMMKQLV